MAAASAQGRLDLDPDPEIDRVESAIRRLDPDGTRIAAALRLAYDQIYNGRYTGRFRWDQLAKVEKTHFGSLVEINLQRALGIEDGERLDFSLGGCDVDCKYSQREGGWMIPPEAVGHICMVVLADDHSSRWSLGLVRCTAHRLNAGTNRDEKKTLNTAGRASIRWVWSGEPFPENVLITLPETDIVEIFKHRAGQRRLDELFRRVQGRRISRGTVFTVAQQDDSMKRARANGGSRTSLRPEGIIILGDSRAHQGLAAALGTAIPHRGSLVAVTVAPDPSGVAIDGTRWAVVPAGTPVDVAAPVLPR